MALLAVPNVSDGRHPATIDAIAEAFTRGGARVLDVHSDADHNRSVYTLTGHPRQLAAALRDGAREAITRIDVTVHTGQHPHIGSLDVAPIVYTDTADRGCAAATALLAGDIIGHELNLPVFLYGDLAGGRTRAALRRGGPRALRQRIDAGELRADFGPRYGLHPTAGAALVAARPPLIAFNVELAAPATLADAQRIAARIRDGGPAGLTDVRAIGIELTHAGGPPIAQVSTNIENWTSTTPAQVLAAISGYRAVSRAELVGLAPTKAFRDFPATTAVRNLGFIEDRL